MCSYQLFLTSGGSGGGNKSHGSHGHHHNKGGHKSKNHGASNTTEEGRGYFRACTFPISTYKYYSIHLTRFVKCNIPVFFISHLDKTCPICLDEFTNPKRTKCGHKFCSGCLEKALKFDPFCPTCKQALRAIIGKQPVGGKMTHKVCPEAVCPSLPIMHC